MLKLNNESLDQLDSLIKNLFKKYFQYDSKNPHVFYVKDITLHNPISELTIDLAKLAESIIESSLEAFKKEALEKIEQELNSSNKSEPEAQEKHDHDGTNFYSSYYDYYADDDLT